MEFGEADPVKREEERLRRAFEKKAQMSAASSAPIGTIDATQHDDGRPLSAAEREERRMMRLMGGGGTGTQHGTTPPAASTPTPQTSAAHLLLQRKKKRHDTISPSDFASAVLGEINKLRSVPMLFVHLLEDRCKSFDEAKGAVKVVLTDGTEQLFRLSEGVGAIEEAIQALKKIQIGSLQPIHAVSQLSRSCSELTTDTTYLEGLGKATRTDTASTFIRHGRWKGRLLECLFAGPLTMPPEEVVLDWLVDDGQPSRAHRVALLSDDMVVCGHSSNTDPTSSDRLLCLVALTRGFTPLDESDDGAKHLGVGPAAGTVSHQQQSLGPEPVSESLRGTFDNTVVAQLKITADESSTALDTGMQNRQTPTAFVFTPTPSKFDVEVTVRIVETTKIDFELRHEEPATDEDGKAAVRVIVDGRKYSLPFALAPHFVSIVPAANIPADVNGVPRVEVSIAKPRSGPERT